MLLTKKPSQRPPDALSSVHSCLVFQIQVWKMSNIIRHKRTIIMWLVIQVSPHCFSGCGLSGCRGSHLFFLHDSSCALLFMKTFVALKGICLHRWAVHHPSWSFVTSSSSHYSSQDVHFINNFFCCFLFFFPADWRDREEKVRQTAGRAGGQPELSSARFPACSRAHFPSAISQPATLLPWQAAR